LVEIELTEIPRLARDDDAAEALFQKQAALHSWHKLYHGDSRNLEAIDNESVHLVVTSPPYWTLKKYPNTVGQLGQLEDYQEFLGELSKTLKECYRVLIPGGRLICVVGDVCLPRRVAKRHVVYPLHSDITVISRSLGFDNLTPILWYKIANAKFEANTFSNILGKPYEPNAVIKNDVEFILVQRKPGPYRKPTVEQRRFSYIPRKYYEKWFRQIWDIRGESTRRHPAPFPLELASRLVRMYSFVGDVILDPFAGTGTTMLAAMQSGRNSIGYEIDSSFVTLIKERLRDEMSSLTSNTEVELVEA
jgi:modification methylase